MKPSINYVLPEIRKRSSKKDSAKIGRFIAMLHTDVSDMKRMKLGVDKEMKWKLMLRRLYTESICNAMDFEDNKIKSYLLNYLKANIFLRVKYETRSK